MKYTLDCFKNNILVITYYLRGKYFPNAMLVGKNAIKNISNLQAIKYKFPRLLNNGDN